MPQIDQNGTRMKIFESFQSTDDNAVLSRRVAQHPHGEARARPRFGGQLSEEEEDRTGSGGGGG